MHEFSLIADLITKIKGIARLERAKKVTGVKVRLGALSHISADHFREHFVHETGGTIAEGATLSVSESDDINDPEAQQIILESVEVEGSAE